MKQKRPLAILSLVSGGKGIHTQQDLTDELGDRLALAEALRALGKAYLVRGELDKARAHAQRAVTLFTSAGSKSQQGVALCGARRSARLRTPLQEWRSS